MKLTLSAKILIVVIILGILATLAGGMYAKITTDQLIHDRTDKRVKLLQSKIKDQIDKKKDIGLTNAVSFSANHELVDSIKTNNRELAKHILTTVNDQFKKNTNNKNIQIHLHTPDQKSFLRSWDTEKAGDDLTAYRYSLKDVTTSKKSWVGFELGSIGIALRGIVPVLDNDMVVGTLEFIQGVGSVHKEFKQDDSQYILLVNEKAAANFSQITKNAKVGSYYVANSNWFTEDTIEFAKGIKP